MSYLLNQAKPASTQGAVDRLKTINFWKLPNIIVVNHHSSCPDHQDSIFAYKGISAVTLANSLKATKILPNEQGVVLACTAKQWSYVPKSNPVVNIRYSKSTKTVHPVPLYLYETEKDFAISVNCCDYNIESLKPIEQLYVEDFIAWRLGEQTSSKNHNLGFQKIYELSALADSFIEISVCKV